jgi:hypothetical protein
MFYASQTIFTQGIFGSAVTTFQPVVSSHASHAIAAESPAPKTLSGYYIFDQRNSQSDMRHSNRLDWRGDWGLTGK